MKRGIAEQVGALFDTAELPSWEREKIEIVRSGKGRRILLCGVKKILRYGETEMIFALREERVVISGKCLVCTAYADGAVSVGGTVDALSFFKEDVL